MSGAFRRGLAGAAVAIASVASVVPAAAQEPEAETVLVTFRSEPEAERAAAEGGVVDRADDDAEAPAGGVVVAELTDAEAAAIAADPRVVAVEPDAEVFAADLPNDPCYTAPSSCEAGPAGAWHVDQVGLPGAWDLTHADAAVVAVIDSGVAPTPIPQLQGKVLTEVDATRGEAPCTSDQGLDVHHGTAVAAVVAARTDDAAGIPGAGWNARVLPIRVFWQAFLPNGTPDCTASVTDIVRAIGIAVERGVTVINISLTTPSPSSALRSAVGSAIAAGIPVVAAAGNHGSTTPEYPAGYPEVIAVGASDRFEQLAWFSNRGAWVDVAAPGVTIPTYGKTGAAMAPDGTSFSAPIVSAVVAMMRSVRPAIGQADAELLLARTADPVGFLRLDARQALLDTMFNRGADPGIGAAVLGVGSDALQVVSRTNLGDTWERVASSAEDRWASIGGLTGSDPDLASSGDGVLDVVVRGGDGGAYHRRRVGGVWSAWTPLGDGRFATGLTATRSGPGALAVFGVGLDGAMWGGVLGPSGFGGWSSIGGRFTTEPDATTATDGRIVVAAVGTDGAMWANTFADGWAGWRSLGGRLTSGPGLVAILGGRVELVARGVDGALYHTAGIGGSWMPWTGLGGFAVAAPDLATRGPGILDVVVRGSDSSLWRRTYTGSWSAWTPMS